MTKQDDFDIAELTLAELHELEVDVDHYKDMLDDPALTDAQKEQIITALWQIVMALVDLGFGVHPAQLACGKDENTSGDSPHDSPDEIG